MDDLIVGYALDALTPAETAAVEAHLAANPADRAKLDRVRRVLAPLAADRPGYDPPPGLAVAAIGRAAAHAVELGLLRADPSADTLDDFVVPAAATPTAPPETDRAGGWRVWVLRRADAAVAACIAVLAVGLVLTGVQKLRADRDRAACQNNLRALYGGLSEYADAHAGRFPQVGPPHLPTAGSFVVALAEAGQLPPGVRVVCPAADAPAEAAAFRPGPLAVPSQVVVNQVGYVYTLGYRRKPTDELVGLWRDDPGLPIDQSPLAADLPDSRSAPAPDTGPFSPHGRGQNVLFVGGHVRYVTRATVGPYGDDIYRNKDGRVQAGLNQFDASLGRAADMP